MTAKMFETMAAAKDAAKTGKIGVAKYQGAMGYIAYIPTGQAIPKTLGYVQLEVIEGMHVVYFSASSLEAALSHFK